MALPNDLPPTPTTEPVAPPPLSAQPTAAQLKGDIESGATGDKNPVRDPGLAPLGTDDEAAGHAPSPQRVATARAAERLQRWLGGSRKASAAHAKHDGVPLAFLLTVALIGVALVGGVWLVR
jgi:hypothetical protein